MTDEERRRIGEAVRLERTRRGMSKEAAAREVGISSITWKRVEDGLRVQDAKLEQVRLFLGGTDGPEASVRSAAARILDTAATDGPDDSLLLKMAAELLARAIQATEAGDSARAERMRWGAIASLRAADPDRGVQDEYDLAGSTPDQPMAADLEDDNDEPA